MMKEFYRRYWLYLVAIVALAGLATLHVMPVADIDIWWHLATGRYLVETGTFLTADPFSLAGDQITPGRELILNSYWLSQLFFYGLYLLLGVPGIIALRLFLLLLPPVAILFFGWRRYPHSYVVMLLALLCGWAMVDVSGIRPNHLTVAIVPLFFIVLSDVGFVDDSQNEAVFNLRKAWLLPPLMLVWANLHGGFLLGVTVIVLYALSETITLRYRKMRLRPAVKLWGVVGATIVCSLLTPNGILPYVQYFSFQGGALQQKTSEYISPLALAKNGILVYWPYFIILILSLLVLVVLRFKVSATRTLILLTLAALSLTAFRYAPLFVGSASVLLIPCIEGWCKDARYGRLISSISILLVTVVIVLIASSWYPYRAGALSKGYVDATRFPIGATRFIEQNDISGVVFTHFNWGGYLAWQMPERVTTFIDGRSLNLQLFDEYTRALWLPAEMQSIFDRRNVDSIIMPRLNPFTGELYGLTDYLWKSPLWVQVYRDPLSMVFIRTGRYPELERRLAIDKSVIYRDVQRDVKQLSMAGKRSAHLGNAARVATNRLLQTGR